MRLVAALQRFASQLLLLGMIAACGGGDGRARRGGDGESENTLPIPTTPVAYRCTQPAEGLMTVPPAAVMGGQIEGRSDGSVVLVSHSIWGVRHVVMMLGADLTQQGMLNGHIDAVPERLFCPSDGGMYSNGVQMLNDNYGGSYVYLKLQVDPAQGVMSGTLRDYGGDGTARRVTGGPIVGTLFDPAEPPSIANMLGDWTLTDAAGRPGEMSVRADGSLQLILAECSYSGSLVPVNGLNLLDLKLRALSSCLADTNDAHGFVVLLPLADGQQQLMLWSKDNAWGFVVQAIGRR
jgi:hypothetical protein